MVLTHHFKMTVVARIKREPKFACELLDEALMLFLSGEPETVKLMLRDLVYATLGFEVFASRLNNPSKSLQRMLSKAGESDHGEPVGDLGRDEEGAPC